MWINKPLLLLLLAALATATSSIFASATTGNVTYNVFTSDRCQPDGGRSISTLMEPQAQEIGYCQNHGIGKSAYNSIEVLGCSDNCLCFKQVASSESDANCVGSPTPNPERFPLFSDQTRASGYLYPFCGPPLARTAPDVPRARCVPKR